MTTNQNSLKIYFLSFYSGKQNQIILNVMVPYLISAIQPLIKQLLLYEKSYIQIA